MRIIYVDDERPAIDNFKLTVANFQEIESLEVFQSGEAALEYASSNTVDVAFLDMEMPGIHGLGLAKALKEVDPDIRIVFVTAFSDFALEAFGVDATGYVLKPYTAADIRKELFKCAYKPLPSHRVVIGTMPNLSVSVDGTPLRISGEKVREMFALLVDSGENGFSVGECIAHLWPDRKNDNSTLSLCRMTWKRLTQTFEFVGVGDILYTLNNRRHLKTDAVSCDLYRMLSGDKQVIRQYDGQYLSEYEWSEERNGQLAKLRLS